MASKNDVEGTGNGVKTYASVMHTWMVEKERIRASVADPLMFLDICQRRSLMNIG